MSFVISPPSEIRACRICVSSLRAFALISVVKTCISPPACSIALRLRTHICCRGLYKSTDRAPQLRCFRPAANSYSHCGAAHLRASASHLRFVASRLRTHICYLGLYKSTGRAPQLRCFRPPATAIRTAVLRTFALISVVVAYISPPAGLRSFAAFARRQQLFALRCYAPAASASHLRFVALRLRTHFCCQNLYKSTGRAPQLRCFRPAANSYSHCGAAHLRAHICCRPLIAAMRFCKQTAWLRSGTGLIT